MAIEKPSVKKIKSERMPDARGYNIINGYAERMIGETKKEHICFLCNNLIPVGSKAKIYTEVANNKLLIHNNKYAHATGECSPVVE